MKKGVDRIEKIVYNSKCRKEGEKYKMDIKMVQKKVNDGDSYLALKMTIESDDYGDFEIGYNDYIISGNVDDNDGYITIYNIDYNYEFVEDLLNI